jgi:predicted dehydrogenase
MSIIRWGIIGCGNVTEVKSGPGFQQADGSELVAVMRRDGALAQDYARRHGVAKWYEDAAALIADPDVDAVYIATPPNVHLLYTEMAATAGKPVYVEKPMARNYAECQAMIEACATADVPLWVAYYRRALPRFGKIKELIDDGAIGDVRFVTVRLYQRARPNHFDVDALPWRVIPEIAGAGIFFDLASHTLDYLDQFLGPIREVAGFAGSQAGRYPAEDTVAGSFVFESGVHGTGVWCFDAYTDEDVTEIVGTAGKLSFSSFGEEPVLLSTADGDTEFAIKHPAHIQQPLIQSIVNEMNGIGQCPSSGESAARTSWVMDQMIANYYT